MQDAEKKTSLICQRKIGESLTIYTTDGTIEIFVHEIQGKRVKLRFAAPTRIDIRRNEGPDHVLGKRLP